MFSSTLGALTDVVNRLLPLYIHGELKMMHKNCNYIIYQNLKKCKDRQLVVLKH